MLLVADASAVLAYLRRETGGEMVRRILADASNDVLMHSVNLCRVYYDVLRRSGANAAANVINSLYQDGIRSRADCAQIFWMDACSIKAVPGRLSLADCFTIALARRANCELLTADHHEMDKLVGTGIVQIRFIR